MIDLRARHAQARLVEPVSTSLSSASLHLISIQLSYANQFSFFASASLAEMTLVPNRQKNTRHIGRVWLFIFTLQHISAHHLENRIVHHKFDSFEGAL